MTTDEILANCVAEKLQRDLDNLTPLDARNSLLMDSVDHRDMKGPHAAGYPMSAYGTRSSLDVAQPYRDHTPPPRPWHETRDSSENLVGSAASMGHRHQRSTSRDSESIRSLPAVRRPTIPDMEGAHGRAY